jgi:regulator of cell morphogenesis and NO signaling
MKFSPDTTVGDLAALFPETVRVFQDYGIEFCCGGKWQLGQVCRDRDLPYAEVAAALTRAMTKPSRADWSTRPLSELTAHLVEAFHEPLRQELPRLIQLATRLQGHGSSHRRALAVVLSELTRFTGELEAHMAAEERDLFPLIDALEREGVSDRDQARLEHLRFALEADHVDAGQTLRLLGQITDHYQAPDDACSTMRALYQGLQELERLMHLNIHLENNVLFVRANTLRSRARSERSS